MTDPLRARYDALPYRHSSIQKSHPARMGAIARMFGIPAAAPDQCRVLELGCAEGMNLLPLAERLPGSQFVGVDFSEKQIAEAEKARVAASLNNARLVCADLRDWEVEEGAFDYVIAHGVYSWVPEDVKEKLLATMRRALAPGGVAYISYNSQPGWGLLGGLRQILLAEMARKQGAAAQIQHLGKVITNLAKCFEGREDAYGRLMLETLHELAAKPPVLVVHDEVALINDPLSFLAMAVRAEISGLRFFAESHFASQPFEHLPTSVQQHLQQLDLDFHSGQQWMDVLFNRRCRSSLFCRTDVASERALRLDAMSQLSYGAMFQWETTPDNLAPDIEAKFIGAHGQSASVDRPLVKAFFLALSEVAPRRIPFTVALDRAKQLLTDAGLAEHNDDPSLAPSLYQMFSLDFVDALLTGDATWLDHGSDQISPLAQWQAKNAHNITNRWHQPVEFQAALRELIARGDKETHNEELHRVALIG